VKKPRHTFYLTYTITCEYIQEQKIYNTMHMVTNILAFKQTEQKYIITLSRGIKVKQIYTA